MNLQAHRRRAEALHERRRVGGYEELLAAEAVDLLFEDVFANNVEVTRRTGRELAKGVQAHR